MAGQARAHAELSLAGQGKARQIKGKQREHHSKERGDHSKEGSTIQRTRATEAMVNASETGRVVSEGRVRMTDGKPETR